MRHRVEYLLVRFLIGVVRVTPGPLVRAGGTVLGLMFYTVDRAHRRIAERNLATAFPSRPDAERRAIARAAFAHFGRLLFELLQFSTLSPTQMLAGSMLGWKIGVSILHLGLERGYSLVSWISTSCASRGAGCSGLSVGSRLAM